jgi:hypothetical protein
MHTVSVRMTPIDGVRIVGDGVMVGRHSRKFCRQPDVVLHTEEEKLRAGDARMSLLGNVI